jgi:3'-phosphoadenosine 5'-phosphosulfate sulfotransferase (PAPS reductase)/FAD synthetase
MHGYDYYLVMFSGGKDSIAAVLHLLETGIPAARIELWHQEIDGREGSRLMDWPCTPAYCRAFAWTLGLQLYFQWRAGGFEREMLRDGQATAPVRFEQQDGTIGRAGGNGNPGTRRRFPQVSADLSVRWCSAYLKIDVAAAAIRNQSRFIGKRTLVISGERAEESAARAKYKTEEPHRTDLRDGKQPRHVDHARPVHGWSETEVWAILERWRINPHPAYRLGWGRVSCAACIFGNANQYASLRVANPAQFDQVAAYEATFDRTIKRGMSVGNLADKGTPYAALNAAVLAEALDTEWNEPIVLPSSASWVLPTGAFGDSTGPS